MLAEITGNIHVTAACLAAAIGVGMIGKGACEAVGRNPGAATQILVLAILSTACAEGIVFFALFLWNGMCSNRPARAFGPAPTFFQDS